MSDMLSIIKNMLGWGDWYVACILMFYTIFYFAVYISCKYKLNTTILLAIFFCIYYIWAYFYYGPLEGHYYRYVWACSGKENKSIMDSGSRFFVYMVL